MIIEKAKENGQINDLLFSAIKNNKVDTIEVLFNYTQSINFKFDYYNAFYLAINSNNREIIELLKTEYNKLPEINNDQRIVKLLEDEKNIRFFYECIENKDYNKTLELIKNISDLNLIVDGTTLLHKIVSLKDCTFNISFIEQILRQNNSILNMKNQDGFTPLHLAIINDNTDIVKYLLKRDEIDLSIKDSNGLTPFELAVKNNIFNIAYTLLFNYSEKIKINLDVNKIFYYVCKNNSNLLFQLLINKLSLPFPDLTLKYEKNQSLLHIVCSNKNNIFSLLLSNFNENLKLLKKLLDGKSNIYTLNERDEDGFTPLHLAIINDNTNIVEYL